MRLNDLKKLKEMDGNMTIRELVLSIEKKNKEEKDKSELIRKTVIDHYTGKYIVFKDKLNLFGDGFQIIKIRSVKPVGYNTDFEELYGLVGTKLRFSTRDLAKYETSASVSDSFTYSDLQGAKIISKEEYQVYLSHYNDITKKLNELVNEYK